MGGGELFNGFGVQDTLIPKLVGFLLHFTGIIIGQDLPEFLNGRFGGAILQHLKNVKLTGSENGSYGFHSTYIFTKIKNRLKENKF